MAFDIKEFTHIVAKVSETLSILNDDDVKVSVEAVFVNNDDDPDAVLNDDDDLESNTTLNLSFPLKNGSAKISIGNALGVVRYYGIAGDLLKEIKFDKRFVYHMTGSFNLALKKIIAADKQNKQIKSIPIVSSEDLEMSKLRAELSSIN